MKAKVREALTEVLKALQNEEGRLQDELEQVESDILVIERRLRED